MRRVVVTGLGVISPIGIGVEEFTNNLKQGKSGIGPITTFDASRHTARIAAQVNDFDPEQFIAKKEARRFDRYAQFAVAATKMAMQQANFSEGAFDKTRAATIVSTGIGGLHTFEKEFYNINSDGPHRVSPFLVPMMICNIAAGCISMEYGFMGPSYCIVSACASGLHGIGDAFTKIAYGECDVVITGGAESAITPLTVAGFAKMKALSTRNDEPSKASRPFDKDRDGFIMGEGAGILILESEELAIKRGAKILAEVVGYGASSDAYHLTAPHPEGEGGYLAMKKAIDFSNFPIEKVNYVNAHGTSTPIGDLAEIQAVKKVFGDNIKNVSVNATKSLIGHLLGAAGAVGSVATIIQICNSFLHPTLNLDEPNPEIADIDFVPNHSTEKKITGGIVNSFGFGGQNASVLFSPYSQNKE